MRSRATFIGAAVVAVIAVGLGLIVASTRDSDDADQIVGGDPGVAHIHGLGIDPDDGALLAATHFGVFRIPDEGPATRIADRFQDTMGFTVVGPGHYLASGHPDMSDEQLRPPAGKPPLLGLVESTDGAKTWVPLSLFGEADFHALVAAHGRIYGYEATNSRFMVSNDKRSWDVRSQGKQLISIAVDPDDADYIVATGEPGAPYISADGGRVFERVDGGPPMLWLSWDPDAGLWGAGPDGAILRSTDRGRTWDRRGILEGEPGALLAHGRTLYAAVEGGAIMRSTDRARSWTVVYRP